MFFISCTWDGGLQSIKLETWTFVSIFVLMETKKGSKGLGVVRMLPFVFGFEKLPLLDGAVGT
jgi:hypothetical protein